MTLTPLSTNSHWITSHDPALEGRGVVSCGFIHGSLDAFCPSRLSHQETECKSLAMNVEYPGELPVRVGDGIMTKCYGLNVVHT